jgi:N-acetylmuramoyl-L-alanine amidase
MNTLKNAFVVIFVSLILSSVAFSQYTTPVDFTENPLKNTVVGSFTRTGADYISLDDLIKILNLTAVKNPSNKKLEIKTEHNLIKISADNSFVVITDEQGNASVVQLSNKVYFAANSFFIPAKAFILLLDKFISEEISYNSDFKKIIIGKIQKPSVHTITGITYEPKTNGTLIRLRSQKKLVDYESWIKYDTDDAEKKNGWLYVTLANATADVETLKKIKPSGVVKQFMAFPSPTSIQLTFLLEGTVTGTEIIQAEPGNDLLINIYTPSEQQLAAKRQKESNKGLNKKRERWKLDAIVIDAGHGGKDPGAIGFTRTKEKDITLSVALKLGRLIEKYMSDVKIVYTRKDDNFVELYRRGQIANESDGKLFISLHCNAAPRKPNPTNGFEVYLLRPGKTESALKIAERENSVIEYEEGFANRYQQLTEENFILLTMAQSAYIKYSERFAELSTTQVQKYTNLDIQGVKQAGFYVLVGASMPNVLVEMGYLSNRSDEKFLKSSIGQQKIAEALFNAVKVYKIEYEKTLDEGAAEGQSK